MTRGTPNTAPTGPGNPGPAPGGSPRAARGRDRSRHDGRFYVIAAAVLLLAIAGLAAGAGGFDAYPTVRLDTDAATFSLATLIALAGLAPWRRG